MIKVLTVAPITNAQLDGILIVGFKAGLWQKKHTGLGGFIPINNDHAQGIKRGCKPPLMMGLLNLHLYLNT